MLIGNGCSIFYLMHGFKFNLLIFGHKMSLVILKLSILQSFISSSFDNLFKPCWKIHRTKLCFHKTCEISQKIIWGKMLWRRQTQTFSSKKVNCNLDDWWVNGLAQGILRLAKQHEPTSSLNEEHIKEYLTCQSYISSREYNNIKPTQDELNYPVAYSIVVHTNFGQVERLIRAIWRPQERPSDRSATW